MSGCLSLLLTFVSFCLGAAGGFAFIYALIMCLPCPECPERDPLPVAVLGFVLICLAAIGFVGSRRIGSKR